MNDRWPFPKLGRGVYESSARKIDLCLEYTGDGKTISYLGLGQLDELFGAPTATRGWNTILSVLRIVRKRAKD